MSGQLPTGRPLGRGFQGAGGSEGGLPAAGCLASALYNKISIDRGASRRYDSLMNQAVAELEKAVEQLGREDLAVFREWFLSFEAAEWDAQIERDISAGKLDKLAAEGIEEFVAGKTRSL